MTIYLIVGLPGAGKTTRARQLERSESALRFTPDDWLMAVFRDDHPTRWREQDRVEQRDRLEGKLLEAGLKVARLGVNVVFDFGFWGRDERSALRWIADRSGVPARVVYLPITYEEQRARITRRYENEPGQFQMSDAELQQWRLQFQSPDDGEIAGTDEPSVAPGYATWWHWASERWPTFPLNSSHPAP